MTTPNKDREAFEAFVTDVLGYLVTRRGDTYNSSHTNLCWITWQAACADRDKRIAELEAQLEKANDVVDKATAWDAIIETHKKHKAQGE